MAPRPPTQRSPRKAQSSGARKTAGPSGLVDPQTVEAVRAATARAARTLARSGEVLGGALRVAGGGSWRWLWPRQRRTTIATGDGLARATTWLGRWSWRRRVGIVRVGHRLLWWGALAILVLVGQALLGAGGDPELLASATIWFATGLAMSVLVSIKSPSQ